MSTNDPKDGDIGGSLPEAAKKRKVKVNADELVTVTRRDSRLAIAPIAGFDRIPAAQVGDGADAAFAYIDVPGAKIDAGHYTVRVRAPAEGVGKVEGTAELVDADGVVQHALPATFDVKSLNLPKRPPFARTGINIESRIGDAAAFNRALRTIVIVIICPNGTTIIIVIRW